MTDGAVARRVLAEYGVTSVESVQPFGDGLINDTLLVVADHREYVVQRLNASVFHDLPALIDNVETVSAHLRGRFVPELVATRGGATAVVDGVHTWRAWRRVPDAEPRDTPTVARVASAAHLLGRFHAALVDLDPAGLADTIPRFHDPVRRLAQLRDAIDADPLDRVRRVGPEVERALASAHLVDLAEEVVASVPRRVAHNDAKLANFLFRDDEAVCLVDLDTVMPTAWFWDVGDLLRSASTRAAEDDPDARHHRADPQLVGAILDGYRTGVRQTTPPTSAEDAALAHAGALITYEQAMRFLGDYLLGDVYYRTTRADQNLDRARGQLALLESMQGTVTP